MAQRIPGGFGGLFVDKEGQLRVVLIDASEEARAYEALGREPFVREQIELHPHLSISHGAVHLARYSYDQLYAWYQTLLDALHPLIPRISGIGVERNQILIGVPADDWEPLVHAAMADAGLPSEAVAVATVPEVRQLSTVRSMFRPVPGGVQIQWKAHDPFGIEDWVRATCTIGPNVRRDTQYGFLVNSHCTRTFGGVDWSDITHYWQPVGFFSAQRIGNEAIDAAFLNCSNPHGCRYSDAALALYRDGVEPEFGRIARPASRNTEELSLSSAAPRFRILDAIDATLDGLTVEKVGRTTGWSGGRVEDGCIDVTLSNGPTFWCQMLVSAVAGQNDSGSPVFSIRSGVDVDLRGILWGGFGENNCYIDHSGVEQCGTSWQGEDDLWRYDHFVASPLGAIRNELSTGFELHFHASSGGGGGIGCEGDPLDPTCPH